MQEIESVIKSYIDPYLKTDFISAKAIKDLSFQQGRISLTINLGYSIKHYQNQLIQHLREQLLKLDAVNQVDITVVSQIHKHVAQRGIDLLPNVKNIIAVASGKGGVGKSTVAVNLALALSYEGAQVGLLDADIYGPSQPLMLGVQEKPEGLGENAWRPVIKHGIQSMSIGYFIDPETPMVWRGPMVTTALQQLLRDTQWQELDYLIIDLPPGTGDIQLTLAQKIPVSGAVIITTPQDIALIDAQKAIAMFQKVRVPILGVIENMSTHICSHCGHEEKIFGDGGGAKIAAKHGTELLGSLPLDIRIREDVDNGCPTVIASPQSSIAQRYRYIALSLAANLSQQAKGHSIKFPKIEIKNE